MALPSRLQGLKQCAGAKAALLEIDVRRSLRMVALGLTHNNSRYCVKCAGMTASPMALTWHAAEAQVDGLAVRLSLNELL